jgi:simple sugar transport system ATP-binding protein
VRTPGPGVAARALSGGNLQKFVIGREILQRPDVLVVNQPTWGVDASPAASIRQALLDLATNGAGVVVVSQDLDELMEISDRFAAPQRGAPVQPARPRGADGRGDRAHAGRAHGMEDGSCALTGRAGGSPA